MALLFTHQVFALPYYSTELFERVDDKVISPSNAAAWLAAQNLCRSKYPVSTVACKDACPPPPAPHYWVGCSVNGKCATDSDGCVHCEGVCDDEQKPSTTTSITTTSVPVCRCSCVGGVYSCPTCTPGNLTGCSATNCLSDGGACSSGSSTTTSSGPSSSTTVNAATTIPAPLPPNCY